MSILKTGSSQLLSSIVLMRTVNATCASLNCLGLCVALKPIHPHPMFVDFNGQLQVFWVRLLKLGDASCHDSHMPCSESDNTNV